MNNTPVDHFGYSPQDFAKFKRYAWRYLLMFSFLYCMLYCCRLNLSNASAVMMAELGWTKADIGILTGTLFWTYGIGQLVNGRLSEIIGPTRFVFFAVLLSALANIFFSCQTSILAMAVLWGLNGFFQSMVWSNGLGILNKWWPKAKRGFATGLATAFTGMAQVVTYLTILFCLELSPQWGWRAAFRYPMIPMVLMLAAFYFFFKEKPEDVGLKAFQEEGTQNDDRLAQDIQEKGYFYPYLVLFREPKVWVFCLISAIAGVGRYGLITWIPTYFMEELGLSIKDGIFSSILLPFGQACAMFVFPLITDKLLKGKREPMLVIASVITICGMCIFPLINSQYIASGMLFVLGVFAMVTGVIWAIAGDIGGRAFSSTVVGVFDWAVYMGAAIQAVAFGYVKDHFGWSAIFVTIAGLYVVLLALTLIARKMKTKRI